VQEGHLVEDLQRRRLHGAHQLAGVGGYRLQPDHGVDQHREEGDHHGHHHFRGLAEAEPGDEQRREHDLGRRLEPDDERVGEAPGRGPDGERDADGEAKQRADHEAEDDLIQRDEEMPGEEGLDDERIEGLGDAREARQDDGVHQA
jgi:hypothetical protein